MIKELKDVAGRIDVLVNNAGFNINAPVLSMKLDDYDEVERRSRTWYLTKLVLRRFMMRKGISVGSSTSPAPSATRATPGRSRTRW